ncbi:MAG: cell wall hydrolase [Lachnospiraceae bacterium]
MEARISHASHFLIGVSRDTRLWGVGVILGAILLSISFFTEPLNRELLVQSKTVNAEEKATAPRLRENFSVNSMLAEDAEKTEQNDAITDVTYIQNGTEIELDEVMPISLEDFDALCKIVHSEAGSEDMEGQILIANVVMNRVQSDIFPSDIQEVILQVGQFEPVSRGGYFSAKPSKTTREAVMRALNGEDFSQGALYFQKSTSKIWGGREYLFRHGNHSFYK